MKISKLLLLSLVLPVTSFANIVVDVAQNDGDGFFGTFSWDDDESFPASLAVDLVGNFSLINQVELVLVEPSPTNYGAFIMLNYGGINFSRIGMGLTNDLSVSYSSTGMSFYGPVIWFADWNAGAHSVSVHNVGKDIPRVYDYSDIPDSTATLPLLALASICLLALRRRLSNAS